LNKKKNLLKRKLEQNTFSVHFLKYSGTDLPQNIIKKKIKKYRKTAAEVTYQS